MFTFISDIIPRIERFSRKLDASTFLTKQHWVAIDEVAGNKQLYIFKDNNELIISNNGRVERAKWEFLGFDTLIIDRGEGSFLFKQGFVDDNVLALKLDNVDQYLFLVDEREHTNLLGNIIRVNAYLNNTYINNIPPPKYVRVVSYSVREGTLEIHQKDSYGFYEVGDKVFLNGKPAPDGRYSMGFLWHIDVKDGRVA